MNEEGRQAVANRRAAMPIVAAWIDECRHAFGRECVDQAMTKGVAARRDYERVVADLGIQAARRWHRANAHRCTFAATEAGRTVGLPSPFGQPTRPTDRLDPPSGSPSATATAGDSAPAIPLVAGSGDWLKQAPGG